MKHVSFGNCWIWRKHFGFLKTYRILEYETDQKYKKETKEKQTQKKTFVVFGVFLDDEENFELSTYSKSSVNVLFGCWFVQTCTFKKKLKNLKQKIFVFLIFGKYRGGEKVLIVRNI